MSPKKKAVDPQAHRLAQLVTSGPLAGKRIVVTRAHNQADGLSSLLRQFGADIVEAPVIEIHPPDSFEALDAALNDILRYDWLILTSVNGVEALFSRLEPLGLSVDSLQHLKIAAIGPATEERIQDHGLVVDVVPSRYVAEEVVRLRAEVGHRRDLGAEGHRLQRTGRLSGHTRRRSVRSSMPYCVQRATPNSP